MFRLELYTKRRMSDSRFNAVRRTSPGEVARAASTGILRERTRRRRRVDGNRAFRRLPMVGSRAMTYIISEPCIDIKDRSCVDVCPVDCIHEFERLLVIDPEECIDCGACEPECPVEAIFPEDALPDKWEPFVKINYAYPEGAGAVNALVQQYADEHNVQNSPPDA